MGLKRIVCVGLLVGMIWGVCQPAMAETHVGQRHNALTPEGPAGEILTLAESGTSGYTIIIPDAADAPVAKAAEQLQYWLKEMTGATLPILAESADVNAKSGIISVGRTTLLEKSFSEMAARKLENGGWGIASDASNLFLWGDDKDRGTANAVFAFLEEDLGCRWYTKDHAYIPQTTTLKTAPVQRTYSPSLKLRDPFCWSSWNWRWSLHNRTNAPDARVPEEYGGRVDYGDLFVHTFDSLIPPGKYFDEHPEYFMLDEKGQRSKQQLCLTNPDVTKLIIEQVHQSLAKHPHAEIVSVSKNDVVKVCACDTCKAVDEAEGSNMGAMLNLVNSVAASVKDQYPHVQVDTLAYMETIGLPKTARPAENVIIRLCNDSVGSWVKPFTPAEDCKFAELMKNWSAVHNNIYIWDYIVNFSHYMAPMPNMEVIAQNIRFFVEHNAKGVMTQGNYQGPGADRELMRSWVIAKLMLYPSLDVKALMDDFIWGHYGKAAEPIAKYNALLEGQAEKHKKEMKKLDGGIRYTMDHPFLSREFLDEATRLFDEAEQLAENEDVRHRVEIERLPILYVFLARGPEFTGADYGQLLERFEGITTRIGVTNLSEGPADLKKKIEDWKKQWEEYQKTTG